VYNASGILDHRLLLQNVENVFSLVHRLEAELGISIPVIDFGGGLGIDYSDREQHVDVKAFYEGMQTLIDRFGFRDRRLIMEIARFLVAASGTYACQVIDRKESRGKTFLVTNGGIHHFMRTALFGENHSATVLPLEGSDQKETVTVTGCLCTSVDVLLKDVELPRAMPGDWILIRKAGCYSLNAAMTHFLSHEMPAEYWMYPDGSNKLIRRRGTYQDLLLNQE